MSALYLFQRLALREVQLLGELDEGYPCAVVAVDRLTVASNRRCILHHKKDESVTNVVIEKDFLPGRKNYYGRVAQSL